MMDGSVKSDSIPENAYDFICFHFSDFDLPFLTKAQNEIQTEKQENGNSF